MPSESIENNRNKPNSQLNIYFVSIVLVDIVSNQTVA